MVLLGCSATSRWEQERKLIAKILINAHRQHSTDVDIMRQVDATPFFRVFISRGVEIAKSVVPGSVYQVNQLSNFFGFGNLIA
jgi:hypothetical protein